MDINRILKTIGKYQVFFVWSWTLHNTPKEFEWPQWLAWIAIVTISMVIHGRCRGH